jgi:hypothetical protein
VSGDLVRREEVAEVVGRLSDRDLDAGERTRLLARLTRLLSGGLRAAGARASLSGRWLAELVTDVVPHLPVRDLETLQQHHGGLTGDALAESLVRSAVRATAGVGAAGGALASVQHAAPPSLLLAPVQLTAETLAVVAVEIKLVAELHVVHGRTPIGTPAEVAGAYVGAWVERRGVEGSAGAPLLGAVLGAAARHQLRRRLTARLARNAVTLAPLLTGALAGAELNRRETRLLGDRVVAELRDEADRPDR